MRNNKSHDAPQGGSCFISL